MMYDFEWCLGWDYEWPRDLIPVISLLLLGRGMSGGRRGVLLRSGKLVREAAR